MLILKIKYLLYIILKIIILNYFDFIEDTYENNKDYNNDPNYIFNDSENSDDESDTSIISESFNEKGNIKNSSFDTSKYTFEGKANCDDTNLIVPKSQEKGANKKYFCMYCKKLQTKFARHLETVHKNETEVKKFILLPKGKYNNLHIFHFKSNVIHIYLYYIYLLCIYLIKKYFII